MKRAAIYARCNQQGSDTLQHQINCCINYAGRQNFIVNPEHIYVDIASGLTRDRPGLNRFLKDAKVECFDVVVIDDLSRISRESLWLSILVQQLLLQNIHLHTVAHILDTADTRRYQPQGLMRER